MKKIFTGIFYALMAIFVTTQIIAYADSSRIHTKPDHVEIDGTVEYSPSYASMNFYTTNAPTYLNLSTTTFQTLKPFATKSTFSNLSASTSEGIVTLKANSHGTYKITMRMAIKATDGSIIYFQTVKNGNVIVNKTLKRMSGGYDRPATMMNISTTGSGATADIISSSNSSTFVNSFTNITSNAKGTQAVSNADGRFYMVNEGGTGAFKGWVARARFDNVDIPERIRIIDSGYDGSNHHVKLRTLNVVFNRYTAFTSNGSDYSDVGSLPSGSAPLWQKIFIFPAPHKNYVNAAKQVKIIFDHTDSGTSTHNFMLDYITLEDCLESYYLEHTEIVSLTDGDNIRIRIGTDTPGTDFYRYVTGLKIDKIGN